MRVRSAGLLALALTALTSISVCSRQAFAEPPAAPAGKMLDKVSQDRRAAAEAMETEVRAALSSAQSRIGAEPAEVYHDLSRELDRVRKSRDLDAPGRARLAAQIRTLMLQASRHASSNSQQHLREAELNAAEHAEAQRSKDIYIDQQKSQRVLSQTAAQIRAQQYGAAADSADLAVKQGHAPMAATAAAIEARSAGNIAKGAATREARHRTYLEYANSTDRSLISVPDNPGIQYPSAEEWKQKTADRAKWSGMADNHRITPAEAKINAALNETSQLDCDRLPLADVIDFLKQKHGIEIVLDRRGMAESLVEPSTEITMHVKGIKLRSILGLVCDEVQLSSVRRDDVILVTSKERAEQMIETRVYPVGYEVIDVDPLFWMRRAQGAGFF